MATTRKVRSFPSSNYKTATIRVTMDGAIFTATKRVAMDVAIFWLQLKGWLWMEPFFCRN